MTPLLRRSGGTGHDGRDLLNDEGVLVVGGTGILAPVVDALQRVGPVVAPSRRTRPAFDGHARGAVVPGVFTAAVVYAPTVSPEALIRVRRAVTGRLVLVQPSAASAPDADTAWARVAARTHAVRVRLGWTRGTPRWHTPEEIAPAVLTSLIDGAPRTVGVVRPWSDRPCRGAVFTDKGARPHP